MKVTENKEVNIKYPCLMISDVGGVIYFRAKGEGVRIKAVSGVTEGHYSKDFNMDQFTLFNGSITLEND